MARNRQSQKEHGEETRTEPRSPARLKSILVLTLIVLTAAFGLMVWNTYQDHNQQQMSLLKRDALLSAERFKARADRTASRIERYWRTDRTLTTVEPERFGVDALAQVKTARASDDPALSRAGTVAREMQADGQRLALIDNGQLVLLVNRQDGRAGLATVDAKRWLQSADTSRIVLYGAATVSAGNSAILPPDRQTIRDGSGFRFEPPLARSATSCVNISGADFDFCMSQDAPLLTLKTGLALLLNLFLIIVPVLSVIALYRRRTPAPAAPRPVARETSDDVRLETAAASAAAGFWTLRPADGQGWISDSAARLLGIQQSGDVDQNTLFGAFASTHHDLIREALADAGTRKAFAVHAPARASDGDRWIEIRGNRVERPDDDRALISGVMFDVTSTVRSRERQRTAEAKLRSAIESFPSPFALWDSQRRLFFWNRAYENVFNLSSVLRPGIKHETVCVARSASVVSETASREESGTTLLGLRDNSWMKLVEQTTTSGILITFGVDVTNDVRNEERLLQQKKRLKSLVQDLERSEGHKAELARKYNEEKARAERSANSKSAFLANMSHELRTPLNAINGFSEILVNEMYGPLGDKRYGDYAKDILTSGQHLLDMINDILDIAKIEAGKMTIDPKPIDLVDPVDAAVRMIRRKAEDKGIQINMQSEERLPPTDADHRAVRQMVLNLLSNAIKFTDAGGRITVAVQRRGQFIRVAVRDTGVGIPKEHLPRLASPFEQVNETRERNHEGTGLGLALTKSFAEMHGGRLTLSSEPGKGTMVCFFLPISADAAQKDLSAA